MVIEDFLRKLGLEVCWEFQQEKSRKERVPCGLREWPRQGQALVLGHQTLLWWKLLSSAFVSRWSADISCQHL